MLRLFVAIGLLSLFVASVPPIFAQPTCRFVLGFAALRDMVGTQKVGDCLEDEHFNLGNGNAEQRTTGGLLVWRKVDNFTAFTDGGTTWVNGPNGLQSRPNNERFSWERDPVGASATRPSEPAPGPASQPAPAAPPANNPSVVAAPAAQPAPSSAPAPRAQTQPVTLRGRGRTATDHVTPPAGLTVASFTHDGKSNFIVSAVRDRKILLVNTIGQYRGQRLIVGPEPFLFDIDADGTWTIEMGPVQTGGRPEFSGRGDAVGSAFDPPANGAWTISHDGKSNFIAELHCAGRSDLVENAIGRVDASAVVTFGRGPCLWEVQADGNWRLAPR